MRINKSITWRLVRTENVWPASVVDTIVVLDPRNDKERAQLDEIVKSRCFADLGPPERVGGLLVYRRSS